MSSTQLTTAAPAGREVASREIDGTNDWTELAARANEGLEVCLLWSTSTGRVKVAVADARLDQHFEFDVVGADALAAFHHPFAYADSLDPQPLS